LRPENLSREEEELLVHNLSGAQDAPEFENVPAISISGAGNLRDQLNEFDEV
jgi:hypothetical protein